MGEWRSGVLGLAALLLAGPAHAQQDSAPPGCRWMDDMLACKDGHGNWRRSGDDEIVGQYATPRPKPAVRVTPTASDKPRAEAPAPPDSSPPATAIIPPAVVPPEPSVAPAVVRPRGAEPPVEPPSKPWWRRVWDWVVNDFDDLWRLLGLRR